MANLWEIYAGKSNYGRSKGKSMGDHWVNLMEKLWQFMGIYGQSNGKSMEVCGNLWQSMVTLW